VQESNTNHRARIDVTRHRARSRLTALGGRGRLGQMATTALGGRGRLGLMATTALVGVGLAAVAATAAVTSDHPNPSTVVASAADQQARAAAAQRGDRSQRTAPNVASLSAAPKAATKATKAATKPKPAPAWVSPMPGAPTTSCFGPRWGTVHEGIDLAMPSGTPIHTIGKGTVIKAGDSGDGYGISVFVDHGNGYLTQYAHMSRAAVGWSQTVKPGQVIGYEGSTGDSTGPHLHFEVHAGMWNQIDPAPWMRAHGVNLGC
jgi:murein DD-endopeptidase MepM/ murein hydrolase activator NlpD